MKLLKVRWHIVTVVLALCVVMCGSCNPANNAPVINSVSAHDTWVELSGSSLVECTADDPDGDELNYTWKVTGGDVIGSGPEVAWKAPNAPGIYTIKVVVTDGHGGQVEEELAMLVMINNPPVIESLSSEYSAYAYGETATIECVAYDPEGEELTYIWNASGGVIEGEGPTVTWITPTTGSTYNITVTVTDSKGGKANQELVIYLGTR